MRAEMSFKSMLKVTRPRAYGRFSCLAGQCPDTCCAGWEVVIDPEAAMRYREMTGEMGGRLRAALENTDGEESFRLDAGRCPFLNGQRLCDIQAALGEGALCRTCRQFPRFFHDYGALREEGLSLSCPEAARLMMAAEDGMALETQVDAALNVMPNDIDAALYMDLRAMRLELMGLIQNRDYALEERMALCIMMARDAQKRLMAGQDALTVCRAYRDMHYCKKRLDEARALLYSGRDVKIIWARWLDELDRLETLNPIWKRHIEMMRGGDTAPIYGADGEYERLLLYYIYRYFLESVYDRSAYRAVKLAVWSVAVIRRLHASRRAEEQTSRIELAHLFSREIEHSEENLDAVRGLLGDVHLGGWRWMVKLCLDA